MKTFTTRNSAAIACKLTGICFLIPLLVTGQVFAQTASSTAESSELAQLRAERRALEAKINNALEQVSGLAKENEARKKAPSSAAEPVAAVRPAPAMATTP